MAGASTPTLKKKKKKTESAQSNDCDEDSVHEKQMMLRSQLAHGADEGARSQGKLPDPRRLNRLAEACASFNIDGSVFSSTGDGKENLLDSTLKGVLEEAYPSGAIGKWVQSQRWVMRSFALATR